MQADNHVRVSLDAEQIRAFKRKVLSDRPYADRVSMALALGLADGIAKRQVDGAAVMNAIDRLEGVHCSSKEPGRPFNHPPLAPLWHTHFVSARHIVKNLAVRWGADKGGNRDLNGAVWTAVRTSGGEPDAFAHQLAHTIVSGGYADRMQQGLTGDWIVFGKHAGLNYYLDLATHWEGERERAHDLVRKLKRGCEAEFPFVF